MSRNFRTPMALSAVLALLAGPALAQDAASPAAPTPPAAEAAAPVALPPALQEAGLTDVTSKRGPRDGSRIEGKLPDGSRIQAMLDAQGGLRGVKAQGEAMLPPALVARLVPQAVRDNAVYAELGSLRAVFTDERGVMLAGQDAQKNRVHAAFASDGTLLRFGRGDDDDRGGKDRGKGWDKDRGHDHGKRHGDRHDDRRDNGRDDRRGDRDGRGPGPDAPPPPPPGAAPGAAPDAAPAPAPERQGSAVPRGALRQALTSAGYSQLGEISRDGARVMAQAVNPEGEPVLVELNPQGAVVREIAR